MESTVALEMSHIWLEMQFIIGLIGGASLLFLLFCLACVGSDFFATSTRRGQSLSSSRHHLKLVPPHHRSSRASRVVSTAQPTKRRITL